MTTAPTTETVPPRTRTVWMLAGIFVLVSAGLAGFGRWYYLHEVGSFRKHRCQELQAVGAMKAGQVAAWRRERLADVDRFATEIVQPELLAWLRATNAPAAAVRARLRNFRGLYGWRDVFLATPDGQPLLTGEAAPPSAHLFPTALAVEAAGSRTPVASDLFRCPACPETHLDVASAVRDEAGRVAAVAVARINPADQLYPLLFSWPLPSASAEVLLVCRQGHEAVVLNTPRHGAAPPLGLREPLARRDLPVVRAACGETGLCEGPDYRGVRVAADLRAVPGTPWVLVAKEDAAEIRFEARRGGWAIAGLVALSSVLAGTPLALIFYFGQATLYQQLFRTLHDSRLPAEAFPAAAARRSEVLAGVAAGFVFLLGVLGLASWLFDLPALTQVVPGYVSMKPNTAVGLLFCGLSLASHTWAVRRGRMPWCARAYAGVVVLLGAVTLVEYVAGWDFGIDQLLFREPVGTPGTLAPGRMAPATTVAFLAAGGALLAAAERRLVPLAQHAALLVLLLGAIPLLGYLYGAPNTGGVGYYIQLAIPTAAAFIVLGLGILRLHPDQGVVRYALSNTLGGWLVRRLLPFVVAVPLALGWFLVQGVDHGLFEERTGAAIMAALIALSLLGLTWWSARALSRIDALRLQRERELHDSREELRAALYGISDGVIVADTEGRVRQMNPAAERLTGWTQAEAQGQPLGAVFRAVNELTRQPLEDPAVVARGLPYAAAPSRASLLLARNGTARPVTDSAAPIRDAHGAIAGLVLVFRDQTEARLAEERVQAEMRKLNAVFECAPVAMVVLDEGCNIVWANSAVASLAGVRSSFDLLGQGAGNAVRCAHRASDPRGCGHGPDCPLCPLRRGLQTMLSGSQPHLRTEVQIDLSRDDAPAALWLRVGVEPIELDGRRHVIVALDDITGRKAAEERLQAARAEADRLLALSEQSRLALLSAAEDQKRTQAALRVSELRFRELFNQMTSGVAIYEPAADHADFFLRDINEAGLQATQRARVEVLGKSIREAFPGIAATGLLSELQRVSRTGAPLRRPPRCYKDDRVSEWFEDRIYRIPTGEVVVIFDNISERMRLELQHRELVTEAQRLREALDRSPSLVFMKDLQSRYTYANQQVLALFGCTPAELQGSDDLRFFPPETAQHVRAIDARVLAGSQTAEEVEVPDTGHGRRTYWEVKVPIYADAASQTIIGLLGISTDITEHKQYDELRVAKEAADAANRAKSTFLANISHEIRTPLNAILGFTQLMQRDASLPAVQRRRVNTIRHSGEHLLALINDVLEMSRIEAGRLALAPTVFDCRALVTDLATLLRPGAEARGLRLEVVCAADLPRLIRADEHRLREVLHNLLGNAVKFTRQGAVTLRAAASVDAVGPRLRFEVEDTGPGIPEEDRDRLFKYFEQSRLARPDGSGSGLGLAISRELVRLMGGDITYTTALGRGTTFRFDIRFEPAAEGDVTPAGSARRVTGLVRTEPPVRALVVDDSEDNRELLVQLLAPAGFELRQAADGLQALREFEVQRPRLLLLDLRMPEMDGVEVIRRVRAAPGGREVRIIVVTASANAEKSREAREAGADAVLVKPFDDAELFARIAALLGLGCTWSSEEPAAVLPEPSPQDVCATLRAAERQALRAAAVHGDFDRVLELVLELEARHPEVARGLRVLAERFDAARLLELLAEKPEGSSS
jgi:PAS domain S-box-containing protein